MIIEIIGIILQVLTVASIAAALLLFLSKTAQSKNLPPTLPQKSGWFTKENRSILVWAVLAAIGSRVLLTGLFYAALALMNTFGSEDLKFLLSGYELNNAFPSLKLLISHWDAPHYLDIAKYGYTPDLTVNLGEQHWFIVFYPLYPALIALFKPLFGNEFNASIVLSWGCLAGACYWLYRLSLLDNEEREARRAIKYLLIFPTAIFLGAPYTESLFLLLSVMCLYSLRKGCWWLAGLLGFFAALARNMGILLAVPFAMELLDRLGVLAEPAKLKTGRFWLELFMHGAWVLLMPLGLCVYLIINHVAYGDPFMFLKIQNDHWGQHAQAFWKTVLVTWNNLTGDRPVSEKVFLWVPQLAGMVALLAALPFMMKKLRPSYAAYLLAYVILSLSPSWLLSFNRYMMGAIPLFLGLAAMGRNRRVDAVLTVVFTVLMLFLATGYVMYKMVV